MIWKCTPGRIGEAKADCFCCACSRCWRSCGMVCDGESKNAMKPDEQAAMDGMIAAARDRSKGGLVKLGKWQDKIQIDGLAGEVPV